VTKPGQDLEIRVENGALWLTMNRPEVLNAMSAGMSDAIADETERAVTRDDVRVVVLTGVGDAFSTGADISGENAHERFDERALDMANRIIRAIVTLDKPVVAAVNGVAAGVGCSAALAADVIVAKESATFLLAFARIGLMPDGGTTATVAASIGRARAMRMGLLAEPLTAREAHDAGLITHVAPDAEYDDLVATIVRRLASGPPLAYAATKRAINVATLGHLEDALERERVGQTVLLRTADVAEGMRAFSERRRPEFRGE
jgi:enoyl-CoA hydratase/carnithine racemase